MREGISLEDTWYMWAAMFVAGSVGVVLFVWRQRRQVVDEDGVCADCGYAVRGLTGPICPECGADRAQVGVRYPSAWNRIVPRMRKLIGVVAWTVWLIAMVWLAWTPYQRYLQPGGRFLFDDVQCQAPEKEWEICITRAWYVHDCGFANGLMPATGSTPHRWGIRFQRVNGSTGSWPYDLAAKRHVKTQLQSPMGVGYFVVDTVASCYAWADRPAQGSFEDIHGGCDGKWQTPLREWLERNWKSSFVDSAYEETIALLNAVEKQPFQTASGTYGVWTLSASGNGYGAWEPSGRYTAGIMAAVMALWIMGVWLLIRRRAVRSGERQAEPQCAVGGYDVSELERVHVTEHVAEGGNRELRKATWTPLVVKVTVCAALILLAAYEGLLGYRYWEFGKQLTNLRASLTTKTIGVYSGLPDEIVESRRGQAMLKDLLRKQAVTPWIAGCVFKDLQRGGAAGLEPILIQYIAARKTYTGGRPYDWMWVDDVMDDFPKIEAAVLTDLLTSEDSVDERRKVALRLAGIPQYLDVGVLRTAFDDESSARVRIGIALALRRAGDTHADAWIDGIVSGASAELDDLVRSEAGHVQRQPHGVSGE